MKSNHFLASALAITFSFILCAEEYPWLSNLEYNNDVFKSGEKLMRLENGLYELEEELSNEGYLVIAIHGSRSRGYEWVYPLKTIDSRNHDIYFFRWNDQACTEPSAIKLNQLITQKLALSPRIEKVILISHSYGGLLTSWFYKNWSNKIPMDVHAIATPIAGIELVNNVCQYVPPKEISESVNVNQWLTQKGLDSAFRDLEFDPQIIELEGNETYLLPSEYRDQRLGHNWSISYVADKLKENDFK